MLFKYPDTRPGSRISRIVTVLERRGDYVLCVLTGMDKAFVTWWLSPIGETLSGCYFETLAEGLASLAQRSGEEG